MSLFLFFGPDVLRLLAAAAAAAAYRVHTPNRVRENLHVVLAMSPIGESFRNRTRMYPGLVNCTTIDWFQPWPADALVEVATKFIQDIPVRSENGRTVVVWVGNAGRSCCANKRVPGRAYAYLRSLHLAW